MRIRFKPWARPELEACYFYENNPEKNKGKWIEKFENKENPIKLELGCGKGNFISRISIKNQSSNYIAIDLIDAMLGLAKRNVEQTFKEEGKEVKNVILIRYDIEQILNIFDENDKIDTIYINFCNPWPKAKHTKRRLTHTKQLEKYKTFLKPGGEIHFKTDDENLYKATIKYLEEAGFKIIKQTENLHKEPIWENNIETEHEKMFEEKGITTKAIIAKKI